MDELIEMVMEMVVVGWMERGLMGRGSSGASRRTHRCPLSQAALMLGGAITKQRYNSGAEVYYNASQNPLEF